MLRSGLRSQQTQLQASKKQKNKQKNPKQTLNQQQSLFQLSCFNGAARSFHSPRMKSLWKVCWWTITVSLLNKLWNQLIQLAKHLAVIKATHSTSSTHWFLPNCYILDIWFEWSNDQMEQHSLLFLAPCSSFGERRRTLWGQVSWRGSVRHGPTCDNTLLPLLAPLLASWQCYTHRQTA